MGPVAWIALGLWSVLSVAGGFAFVRAWRRAMRLPDLHPAAYLAAGKPRGEGPVVVCAGDSITHGHVSASWVEALRGRLGPEGYTFVNAGINGELSYNLLQRMDEILACDPDVVTVLVGTNDATASLVERKRLKARQEKGLPQNPDPRRYREWLTAIVTRITGHSSARVVLLSPPPIGEDLDAPIALRAAEYAATVEEVAEELGVGYLPLHERMAEVIRAGGTGHSPTPYDERDGLVAKAMFAHHLLGRSFDEIGRRNGYVLLSDALHLGDRAAAIAADLLEDWLRG